MSQVQDLQVVLHDIHAEGMNLSEMFQVVARIKKLPPRWVDFKNYLKHKRKEMSVEDLIVRLRIEEDNKLALKKSYVTESAKENVVEAGHSSNANKGKAFVRGKGKMSNLGPKGKAFENKFKDETWFFESERGKGRGVKEKHIGLSNDLAKNVGNDEANDTSNVVCSAVDESVAKNLGSNDVNTPIVNMEKPLKPNMGAHINDIANVEWRTRFKEDLGEKLKLRWADGGRGGSIVRIGGKGGSIAGIGGGSLAKRSMESNDGLVGEGFVVVGSKFMASGEECLDGWVRAGRREVKGGGVVFGVSRILLGEIPRDIMGDSSGEAFEVDGGAD
ncbi:hypothetical protein Tco_1055145 [Tanacetum coccineum]|uniref:Uncharacterized protein n=1 Tax=Tanacetum coccineum TaxID=301880 RepID=A0ABQ5GYS4_9ASTR